MSLRRTLGSLLLLGGLFFAPAGAQAGQILLYNTGVDGAGNALVGGSVVDAHYNIVAASGAFTSVVAPQGTHTIPVDGFPIGPWVANSSTSRWISFGDSDADGNGPGGTYIYRTTFDLTGLDPVTASISGQWSTDNPGAAILINGTNTGNSIPASNAYLSLHNFAVTSGFVAGVNTLDFVVSNEGGPTGLRVEGITGTASPLTSAVPEPSSIALVSMATASLASYFGWRRRKQPVPA